MYETPFEAAPDCFVHVTAKCHSQTKKRCYLVATPLDLALGLVFDGDAFFAWAFAFTLQDLADTTQPFGL